MQDLYPLTAMPMVRSKIKNSNVCALHPYSLKGTGRDGGDERDEEKDGRDSDLASSFDPDRGVAVGGGGAAIVLPRARARSGPSRASAPTGSKKGLQIGAALINSGDVGQLLLLRDVAAADIGEPTEV